MYRYGIGYIGQGSSYNFISAYLVLYLTNCVGLNATTAGAISSIALFVEAVIGMVIGSLSDSCTSKMGRRRPYMLLAACGVPPVLILITIKIEASLTTMIIYYLVLSVLFRIFFSCFEIPNNAFGAEIVSGYDERTKLRTVSRAFSIIGNAIGYIMPLLLLDAFGENTELGWRMSGLMMAFFVATFWLLEIYLTRGRSVIIEEKPGQKRIEWSSFIKNYLQLLKLKTMKILIVYKAGFACAFALYNVGTLYYLQICLKLENTSSSFMYAFQILIFVIMTPIINKIALKIGKSAQQMYALLIGGIVGICVFVISPNSVVGAVIYIAFFSVVQTGFWQISSSIFYDVAEVDEYVNNKRREGDIMSLVSVLGTLVTAVMVQIFGIGLDLAGFEAEIGTQAQSVVSAINFGYILVPSVCFIIAAISLKVFPINKKTFESLQMAIKLRENGKDYSMYLDDVNKIIK